MKNFLLYYFLIVVPFALIILATKRELISSGQFLILFIIYAFPYRGVTDYYRLRSKNIITQKQFLLIFIPGSRIKYFKELYFI